MIIKLIYRSKTYIDLRLKEARIEIDTEFNEELEKFAIDSENHTGVQKKYLELLNIRKQEEKQQGLPEEDIDLKQMDGTQMYHDILKYIRLAKNP